MGDKNTGPAAAGDREIVATRVFDAPRERVFGLWTDREHVAHWWGPRGFTSTIHEMDVRPGGVWRFVMHGPDGTDYPNRIVYEEIVRPERIVLSHESSPRFRMTALFADAGGKTELTVRMRFDTPAGRDVAAEKFGAVEGLGQMLTRLGEQATNMQPSDQPFSALPFVVSRTFDAPRGLVWKAWTERDRMAQWLHPKGFTMPAATLDFRPGGMFHYCLRGPEGAGVWRRFVYREIVAPERVVLVSSCSDEAGGLARHPTSPGWPLEMLSTVTFAEHAGRTAVTLRWDLLNPTADERSTFEAARGGMTQGWAWMFDQLAAHLAGAASGGA